jgi:hypothetical protein
MAKPTIPDPLARRLLLERELDVQAARRIGEAYLAEERRWEAIAFLHKAGARELLEGVREDAVGAGDAFLLREVSRALGEEPGAARWRALAEAARAAGKERYAAQAVRQLERAEAEARAPGGEG